MGTALGIVFGVLCALGMLWCVWGLYQNEKTFKDRSAVIEAMTGHPRFWDIDRDYNAVTYEQHARAREFLRDPWALYSQLVRDALAAHGGKEG